VYILSARALRDLTPACPPVVARLATLVVVAALSVLLTLAGLTVLQSLVMLAAVSRPPLVWSSRPAAVFPRSCAPHYCSSEPR
jgi:hypothetical protein